MSKIMQQFRAKETTVRATGFRNCIEFCNDKTNGNDWNSKNDNSRGNRRSSSDSNKNKIGYNSNNN